MKWNMALEVLEPLLSKESFDFVKTFIESRKKYEDRFFLKTKSWTDFEVSIENKDGKDYVLIQVNHDKDDYILVEY